MSSVNKVILLGNVGKDPEIRNTQDGRPIANFSIATSERWRDKASGEQKEKTEWHNVVVFNENIAKVVEQYVKKGAKIYVEGQMQTRKWEKDGVTHYSTEVVLKGFKDSLVLLGDRSSGSSNRASSDGDYGETRTRPSGGSGAPAKPRSRADDMDDEIPFSMEWRA